MGPPPAARQAVRARHNLVSGALIICSLTEANYIARPDDPNTPNGLREVFMTAKELTFRIGAVARTWALRGLESAP